MSQDDFGTLNLRRGERAREIEVLRQHYRHHREALAKMTADAPTEHLATEYQRLILEIDRALGKLDELESLATAPAFVPPPPPPPRKTEPGSRPLLPTPMADQFEETGATAMEGGGPQSRVALILVAAVVALALIGWLIWKASSDRGTQPVVAETNSTSPIATQSDVAASEPVAAAELTVSPSAQDYGTINKGTRATRQYDVANNTEEPITIQVARSACRCLYYEHAPVIPPKAKETLTVTIDGARAKAGPLREQVKISAKSDPAVATSIDVIATIR